MRKYIFLSVLVGGSLLASNELFSGNAVNEGQSYRVDRIWSLSERDLVVNARDLLIEYERAYIVRYNIPKDEYDNHALLVLSRTLVPLLDIEVEKLIKAENQKKFTQYSKNSSEIGG